MLYPTVFITFYYLFKLITKTRLSNNSFKFINYITIKYSRLVIFVWLFLTIPRVCLQFVIVVFPDQLTIFDIVEESLN